MLEFVEKCDQFFRIQMKMTQSDSVIGNNIEDTVAGGKKNNS